MVEQERYSGTVITLYVYAVMIAHVSGFTKIPQHFIWRTVILSLQAELEVMFVVKLPNAFPHRTPFRSDPVGQKKHF